MRNRCRGKYRPKVASAIDRNYGLLLRLCAVNRARDYGPVNDMDIFQETVLFVTHDDRCRDLRTDDEIVRHFVYRYRMVHYQTIKDESQHKTIRYADAQKTPQTDIPE